METKAPKLLYLEVMRIIAIFFVIFNHTGTNGYFLFSLYPMGSFVFWIYLFIPVFCKFSVPLFFAISGAIMLNRDQMPLNVLWKKRIFKMILTLAVISFVYYFCDCSVTGSALDIKYFLRTIYTSGLSGHLWYIYAYIAYLISLPFLQALACNLNIKHYYYMIGIALCINAVTPIFDYLMWKGEYTINGNLKATWLVSNIVLYPCIGYFLEHKIDIDMIKKKLPVLWLINIITILIVCYMTYYKGMVTGVLNLEESQGFYNCFLLVNCIVMFLTVKYICTHIKISGIMEKFILSMGKCTFGIYMVHLLIFRNNFIRVNIFENVKNAGCNYMIAVFLWCLCVMVVGYLITLLLTKIPVVRKLVGG